MTREIGPINQADAERFKSKLGKPTWEEGCIPWLGRRDYLGYGILGLNGLSNVLAHRVAYQLDKGPIPPNLIVLHSCDNPWCCNPDHLGVGTDQDNTDDMISKDRAVHSKGEKHGMAIITEAQAKEIIRLRKEGHGNAEIRRLLNDPKVTEGIVTRIIFGHSWKHLPR